MTILFAPSEGKKQGGDGALLSSHHLMFPELFSHRNELLQRYEHLISEGNIQILEDLFGIKDTKLVEMYQRSSLFSTPTLKAIERYDGVAYDYLDYTTLDKNSQDYIDSNVIIFSNLFGPLKASNLIPDYKLKQGATLDGINIEKYYKALFSDSLNTLVANEDILDLRAGFYDKFYTPEKKVMTLKFLKEGKVVSHWAKAYRGKVLREIALQKINDLNDFLAMTIEGLHLKEIRESKKGKEVIYTIE